jgi:cell division protein FtsN
VAKVMEREQSGRTVYRVRLGPMDTRDEAEGLQRKIEGAGFEANLVRVQR